MILFVDDEPRIMDSYRTYLELKLAPEGCKVVFHSDVDKALDFFESHLGEIRLVILDIMMPTGRRFRSSQSNGGLLTGLLVYDRIRAAAPELPVLFFTNYSYEDEKRLSRDRNCRFCQKGNYLLDDFVLEVKRCLSNGTA